MIGVGFFGSRTAIFSHRLYATLSVMLTLVVCVISAKTKERKGARGACFIHKETASRHQDLVEWSIILRRVPGWKIARTRQADEL
eukprot:6415108-Amphidinium_carterae.1